jgi:hypothetical protein
MKAPALPCRHTPTLRLFPTQALIRTQAKVCQLELSIRPLVGQQEVLGLRGCDFVAVGFWERGGSCPWIERLAACRGNAPLEGDSPRQDASGLRVTQSPTLRSRCITPSCGWGRWVQARKRVSTVCALRPLSPCAPAPPAPGPHLMAVVDHFHHAPEHPCSLLLAAFGRPRGGTRVSGIGGRLKVANMRWCQDPR